MNERLIWARWQLTAGIRWLRWRLGWGVTAGMLGLLCAILTAIWMLGAPRAAPPASSVRHPNMGDSAQQRLTDAELGLSQFNDLLPSDADVPGAISELLALGEENGLVFLTGDYQRRLEPAGAFARNHITLPVRGEAGDVQRFLLAALQQFSTLSVESVLFKRQTTDTGEVESRIQLYLLTDGHAAPNAVGTGNQ